MQMNLLLKLINYLIWLMRWQCFHPKPWHYTILLHKDCSAKTGNGVSYFIRLKNTSLCIKSFLHQRLFGNGFATLFSPFRETLEKIIIQDIADFQQQIGVNPFAVEDFVGVLPRAAKLRGQPSVAAPLSCQFCLDEFAYVRFFVHRFAFAGSLARWAKKTGGTVSTYPSWRHRQTPWWR